MKKEELETAVVFVKKIHGHSTPAGDVHITEYDSVWLQCSTSEEVNVGDRIRIEKGRKYPVGTEGIVMKICNNQFAHNFRSALTGREIKDNPCLNVQLDNGELIWVVGENCLNLTSLSKSIDGKIYTKADNPGDYGYVSDSGCWYLDYKQRPVHITSYLTDYGMSIYENYFTETEDEYVMVLDDWRSDTYPFLVIKKEIKSGNQVIYHRNGRDKRFTDMWDAEGTGLSESIKEYEEYLKSKEVA